MTDRPYPTWTEIAEEIIIQRKAKQRSGAWRPIVSKRKRHRISQARCDEINAERDAIRETGGHPDGKET